MGRCFSFGNTMIEDLEQPMLRPTQSRKTDDIIVDLHPTAFESMPGVLWEAELEVCGITIEDLEQPMPRGVRGAVEEVAVE